MPLIRCPECRERISDRAGSCPHCGYARHRKGGSELWQLFIGFGMFVILAIIVVILMH